MLYAKSEELLEKKRCSKKLLHRHMYGVPVGFEPTTTCLAYYYSFHCHLKAFVVWTISSS